MQTPVDCAELLDKSLISKYRGQYWAILWGDTYKEKQIAASQSNFLIFIPKNKNVNTKYSLKINTFINDDDTHTIIE